MKWYTVEVRSDGKWRKFQVTGHTYSNVISLTDDGNGKKGVVSGGPVRLELWHGEEGVTVFGDLSKLEFKLGPDWFKTRQEEKQ